MRRSALFVLIEGLGYDLIQETGFLDSLAPHRYRLRTVLGDSFAALPTILTAAAPADHGRWARFSYDPGGSPFARYRFLRHLPPVVAHSSAFRSQFGRIIARHFGWTGGFDLLDTPLDLLPWLDYSGKRNPFEPGGLTPCASAIDRLHQERIGFFLGSDAASDAQSLEAATAALGRGDVGFALVHARELGPILHQSGPGSYAAREKLRQLDGQLRQAHDALAQDAAVRLYVGTDHGVTEVVERIDVRSLVETKGLTLGQEYFAFYEPTMARFWFADAPARHRIMGSVADVTHGRWLADDQLRIEGVYFPDHRYGEAIFLLEPGRMIAPNYVSATTYSAVGGYYPDHSASSGAFCANLPLEIPPRLIGDLCHLILECARWATS